MSSRRRLPRTIELEVLGQTEDGYGFGTAVGRQCVVKGALPGEVVCARVLGKRKGQILAITETVQNAVDDRTEPFCAVFPRCGGCNNQQWEYREQLKFKERWVRRELSRHQLRCESFLPTQHGSTTRYRRRARLGVRWIDKVGEVYVGFRETFGSYVVDMNRCPALVPGLAELIGPLRDLITRMSTPKRIPQVEVVAGDKARALVLRHLDPLTVSDLNLLSAFSNSYDVWVYGQSGGYETVTRHFPPGDPDAKLTYELANDSVSIEFGPTDFIQVNSEINHLLIGAVLKELDLGREDRVIDLFCGIGNFSLPAARTAKSVLGLEISSTAVEQARRNAERNDLSRTAKFLASDLYRPIDNELTKTDYKMLLDPPRSGAGPEFARFADRAKRVVYVSCNPTTFADDAAVLDRVGFQLERVQVFDMFPHTNHVEIVGSFGRFELS